VQLYCENWCQYRSLWTSRNLDCMPVALDVIRVSAVARIPQERGWTTGIVQFPDLAFIAVIAVNDNGVLTLVVRTFVGLPKHMIVGLHNKLSIILELDTVSRAFSKLSKEPIILAYAPAFVYDMVSVLAFEVTIVMKLQTCAVARI